VTEQSLLRVSQALAPSVTWPGYFLKWYIQRQECTLKGTFEAVRQRRGGVCPNGRGTLQRAWLQISRSAN